MHKPTSVSRRWLFAGLISLAACAPPLLAAALANDNASVATGPATMNAAGSFALAPQAPAKILDNANVVTKFDRLDPAALATFDQKLARTIAVTLNTATGFKEGGAALCATTPAVNANSQQLTGNIARHCNDPAVAIYAHLGTTNRNIASGATGNISSPNDAFIDTGQSNDVQTVANIDKRTVTSSHQEEAAVDIV